ncbi:unnamed protein product [Didymodactylos carnosus]|uniref:Uncharacterized protein n=1 Tax=Didymodactylos carnosus TaxID=1234261 RepID=A0A813UKF4_9BILA|nr:unnamed protein product [Didymodactylos carnosus]CAF3611328.1 unnamed protein product [Didymodactylos carnosus]
MVAASQRIKTTFLNCVKKTELQELSNDECLSLIDKLCCALDEFDDEPNESLNLTDVAVNQDVLSHTLLNKILDQNDLLVKTLCSQYCQLWPTHAVAAVPSLNSQSQSTSKAVTSFASSPSQFNHSSSRPYLHYCRTQFERNFDPLLKSSLQAIQNDDINEFNHKLIQSSTAVSFDIIECNFTCDMINSSGIHLNAFGTDTLSNCIDDYLKTCV